MRLSSNCPSRIRATSLDDLLADTGRSVGRPWRKDHKLAMAAAIAARGERWRGVTTTDSKVTIHMVASLDGYIVAGGTGNLESHSLRLDSLGGKSSDLRQQQFAPRTRRVRAGTVQAR